MRELLTVGARKDRKFPLAHIVVGHAFDDKVSGQRFIYHGALSSAEEVSLFVKTEKYIVVHLDTFCS
jgi:hypothetical protein